MDDAWNKMVVELGPEWELINNQICNLHLQWKLVKELYGDRKAVELMKATIPYVVRAIQDSLTDVVELGIAKLLDPANSGKDRDNLTLARLAAHPRLVSIEPDLSATLASIKTTAAPIVQHRMKRIAHADLRCAVNSTILPPVAVRCIESTLEGMSDFGNQIAAHFNAGNIAYAHSSAIASGTTLLNHLFNSPRLHDLRDQVYAGKLTPEQLFERTKERNWFEPAGD